MSLKKKRAARRAAENEILKQMQEAAGAEQTVPGEGAAREEDKAGSPSADPSLRKVAGYTPMTDEQIKKVKLILWPILFVIAVVVYLFTHGIIK